MTLWKGLSAWLMIFSGAFPSMALAGDEILPWPFGANCPIPTGMVQGEFSAVKVNSSEPQPDRFELSRLVTLAEGISALYPSGGTLFGEGLYQPAVYTIRRLIDKETVAAGMGVLNPVLKMIKGDLFVLDEKRALTNNYYSVSLKVFPKIPNGNRPCEGLKDEELDLVLSLEESGRTNDVAIPNLRHLILRKGVP